MLPLIELMRFVWILSLLFYSGFAVILPWLYPNKHKCCLCVGLLNITVWLRSVCSDGHLTTNTSNTVLFSGYRHRNMIAKSEEGSENAMKHCIDPFKSLNSNR